MDRNEDGTPEALRKLFSILNIMALDIECLSCNKVRPSFLQDMKRRMSGNVCKNYHRISRKLAVKAQQDSKNAGRAAAKRDEKGKEQGHLLARNLEDQGEFSGALGNVRGKGPGPGFRVPPQATTPNTHIFENALPMTTPTQDLKHTEGFWGLASHEKRRSNSKNPFKSPFVGYSKQSSQGLPFQSPFANNRFQAHLEKENLKIFQERTPQNQTKWRIIDQTPELTMAQTHGLGRLDEMEATPDVFSKNKGSLMGDLLGSGAHEGLELEMEDDQRLLILSGHKFFGDLDTNHPLQEPNTLTGIANLKQHTQNDTQSLLINDSNRGLIVHNNNCISLKSSGNFTSQSGFYQGANNQANHNNIKNIQNRNQVAPLSMGNSNGHMVMNQNQILRNKRGRASIHNANHIRRTLWPLKEIPNREDDFGTLFSDRNLKATGAAFGSKLLDFGGEQFKQSDHPQAHRNGNLSHNIKTANQSNFVHEEMAKRGRETGFYANNNHNKIFNHTNSHNHHLNKNPIFQHQGLGDIQEVAEEEDFFNEDRITEKGEIELKPNEGLISNLNHSKLHLIQDQNSSNLFQNNEMTTFDQVSNKFGHGNTRIYSKQTKGPNPKEIKKASNNHPILHNDHLGTNIHSRLPQRTRSGTASLIKSHSQIQTQTQTQTQIQNLNNPQSTRTRNRSKTHTNTSTTHPPTTPNPTKPNHPANPTPTLQPNQLLDQCQHFFDNSLQRILDSVEGQESIYQSENHSVVDLIIETKLNLDRSKNNTPNGSLTDQRITRFLMSNEKNKQPGSLHFNSGEKRRSSARELLRLTELSRTDRKRKTSQSFNNLFDANVQDIKPQDAQGHNASSTKKLSRHLSKPDEPQANIHPKDTTSEENAAQREEHNTNHFKYAVALSGNKANHEASKRVSTNVTKWANSPIFRQPGQSGASNSHHLGLDEAVRLMQQSSIQSNHINNHIFLDWSLAPQQHIRTPLSLSKQTAESSGKTGSQILLKAHVELDDIKERQEANAKYASRPDQNFRHLQNMESFSPEAVKIMNQNLDREAGKEGDIHNKSAFIDRRISFSNPSMFVAQNSNDFKTKASIPKNLCQIPNPATLTSNLLRKNPKKPESATLKTNAANATPKTNLPPPPTKNLPKAASKPIPAQPTPKNAPANPPKLSQPSPAHKAHSVSPDSNSKSMEIRMKNVNGKFILTSQTPNLQNLVNTSHPNLTVLQSDPAQIPIANKSHSKSANTHPYNIAPPSPTHSDKYTPITNNKKRRNGNRIRNGNHGNAKSKHKLHKKRTRKPTIRSSQTNKETGQITDSQHIPSMMIRNLHDLPKDSLHLSPAPKIPRKHPLSSTSFLNAQNCPLHTTSTPKPLQITPQPHLHSLTKGLLTQSTKIDDFNTPDAYQLNASALFLQNTQSEGLQSQKRGRRQKRPIGQFEADEMGGDPLNKRTSSFAKRMATPDENAERGFRGTKRVSRPVFPDTRF